MTDDKKHHIHDYIYDFNTKCPVCWICGYNATTGTYQDCIQEYPDKPIDSEC